MWSPAIAPSAAASSPKFKVASHGARPQKIADGLSVVFMGARIAEEPEDALRRFFLVSVREEEMTNDNKNTPSKAELEIELDKALEATFPASDPVAVGDVTSDTPDRPRDRRPAVIDKALVEMLAKEVADRKGAA